MELLLLCFSGEGNVSVRTENTADFICISVFVYEE
jgi:hypothetical protein